MDASYFEELPQAFASKADAVVLLGDHSFPVHTQIVSLHSPVLATLLAGAPSEPLVEGEMPAYRLSAPPAPLDGSPDNYGARKLPTLTEDTFSAVLAFCYGKDLEFGRRMAPLSQLLDVAALLGCRSLKGVVDWRVVHALVQEEHADLAGAAALATKHSLVETMAAIIPMLSKQGQGHGGDRDWEAAFDNLDSECKRLAFQLARAAPEERAGMGLTDILCALNDSEWESRRPQQMADSMRAGDDGGYSD